MVGFDLGPLLEGQMKTAKLKSAYNLLIIGPRGFGALSLRWIQYASVFRCARSSKCIYFTNETGSCKTTAQLLQNVYGVDITHDNVCSSMLSCFFSYAAILNGTSHF